MIILYNFSHPPMSTQFYRLKTVGTGVNIPCHYLRFRISRIFDEYGMAIARIYLMPNSSF